MAHFRTWFRWLVPSWFPRQKVSQVNGPEDILFHLREARAYLNAYDSGDEMSMYRRRRAGQSIQYALAAYNAWIADINCVHHCSAPTPAQCARGRVEACCA